MGFWEPLVFWIFAAGIVGTSLGVLFIKNPLYAALCLVGDFLCFAVMYALLSAHFLAVTQVLVYTGAIMILFLFIIMLLNLSEEELGERQFRLHHILAYVTGGAVFIFALSAIGPLVDHDEIAQERQATREARQQSDDSESEAPTNPEPFRVESRLPGLYSAVSERAVNRDFARQIARWQAGRATPADGDYRLYDPNKDFEVPPAMRVYDPEVDYEVPPIRRIDKGPEPRSLSMFGTVEPISIFLVNRFVVPFELIAVLLLAAIFGAVVIAKKRL